MGRFTWGDSPAAKVEDFTSGVFNGLPYRMLVPKPLQEPTAKRDPAASVATKYPLVLFLHGAGERGDDNQVQLKHGAKEFARRDRRDQFPAFVVFPQCPVGSRWVESPWDLTSGRGEFARAPSTPMKVALELVDHLIANESVDPDRVYVTGLSMGGQGTWFAAATKPNRFAAMLEVCGGGDPTWAQDYAGIPIWGFHGQADKVVPIGRGREMIAALTLGGHHPELRFTEYPGVGHDSWTQTYSRDDVFEWLFSQSKQTSKR
ncbi:Prolyl oligopeptidase family protein [Rubripirellula reticaptiva]|uniref:Prolyl oligopeptidase family protein n=2 Tax=Rubripirellula reticaptiva TaxID=2528013 RepID=A0A5C6FDV5_9BACT|nr:Prolyl oligopeptidase family protein [Rubripirellula reticaptiva]